MANIKLKLKEPLTGGGQEVIIDGREMTGLGISSIHVKAEVEKPLTTILELNFNGHEIELDGCIQVDGIKLPPEIETAIFNLLARHINVHILSAVSDYFHGEVLDEIETQDGTLYVNKTNAFNDLSDLLAEAIKGAAEVGLKVW